MVDIGTVDTDLLQDQIDNIFELAETWPEEGDVHQLLKGAGNLLYQIWVNIKDGHTVHVRGT